MPEVCSPVQRSSRRGRRAIRPYRPEILVRPIWPSPFTSQPYADACITDEGDGVLTLHVGDRCLAILRGLAVDQPYLNRLLDSFRQRPPRSRR